jgi:hypothetical protein
MSSLPLILSNVVLLFLLTWTKLLNTVDHPILVGWFANYLSQRLQSIKSKHLLSHLLLGPTLFSIYINNIAQAVRNSLIHLYVDDTVSYSGGPSLDFE